MIFVDIGIYKTNQLLETGHLNHCWILTFGFIGFGFSVQPTIDMP
jgi:hypothetical protein